MNTRPKRQEGTYQAPEVKLAESSFSQSFHMKPEQRGIGRKSDIWSFGCILSEVLAFSLGRDELVRDFQSARKQNARDDYFYTEKPRQTDQYLRTADRSDASRQKYEVRPTVLWWLDSLCRNTANPQNWVDCYVGTVRRILIVDTMARPDAVELLKLLWHVREHVRGSRSSSAVACPILDLPPPRKEGKASPISEHTYRTPLPASSAAHTPSIVRKPVGRLMPTPASHDRENPNPIIVRTSTFEQPEIIHEDEDENRNLPDDTKPPESNNLEAPTSNVNSNNLSSISETSASITNWASQDDGIKVQSDPRPIQNESVEPDHKSGKSSGTKSLPFSSFAKPNHACGIMVDRAVPMTPNPPSCIHLPKAKGVKLKIISMSLTRMADGARLACLTKSSVYIYTLSAKGLSVTPDREISLTNHSGWKGIAIADDFLAVWGYSSGKVVSRAQACLGAVFRLAVFAGLITIIYSYIFATFGRLNNPETSHLRV
jgi:hypothetical protein